MTERRTQEISTKDQTPAFIQKLGDVRIMFLDETVPVANQQEKLQRAYRAIWDICSVYFPQPNSHQCIGFAVPPGRLSELGLVSDQTRDAIDEIQSTPDDKDTKNAVEIRQTIEGFMLKEKYHDVKKRYMTEDGEPVRVDHSVEEKAYLTRDSDGQFVIKIESRTTEVHEHFLGTTWDPRKTGNKEGIYAQIENNVKSVNTTLALLVEGVASGYIK